MLNTFRQIALNQFKRLPHEFAGHKNNENGLYSKMHFRQFGRKLTKWEYLTRRLNCVTCCLLWELNSCAILIVSRTNCVKRSTEHRLSGYEKPLLCGWAYVKFQFQTRANVLKYKSYFPPVCYLEHQRIVHPVSHICYRDFSQSIPDQHNS